MKAADYRKLAEKPKRKYRNIPVVVDSIRFDSKAEARRWGELRLLQHAGKIRELERQVPFDLCVEGTRIGKIILDFIYIDPARGIVHEDVKGYQPTPLWRWKAKHFTAQYGKEITIVR